MECIHLFSESRALASGFAYIFQSVAARKNVPPINRMGGGVLQAVNEDYIAGFTRLTFEPHAERGNCLESFSLAQLFGGLGQRKNIPLR